MWETIIILLSDTGGQMRPVVQTRKGQVPFCISRARSPPACSTSPPAPPSRRRDYQPGTSPSPVSRHFNMDAEGMSAYLKQSRRRVAPPSARIPRTHPSCLPTGGSGQVQAPPPMRLRRLSWHPVRASAVLSRTTRHAAACERMRRVAVSWVTLADSIGKKERETACEWSGSRSRSGRWRARASGEEEAHRRLSSQTL